VTIGRPSASGKWLRPELFSALAVCADHAARKVEELLREWNQAARLYNIAACCESATVRNSAFLTSFTNQRFNGTRYAARARRIYRPATAIIIGTIVDGSGTTFAPIPESAKTPRLVAGPTLPRQMT
jgi:hypothetical protein